MKRHVHIVRTLSDWHALGVNVNEAHVADVETKGLDPKNGKLLGLSLSPLNQETFANGAIAVYVVVQEYLFERSEWRSELSPELYDAVGNFLSKVNLVGHNYCYDRSWLNHFFKIETQWIACTRLMWHMSDNPMFKKGYALKDAQVTLLKWDSRGDVELSDQVKARGGSLKKGDHYLADTDVLAYYAGLDSYSTKLLFHATKPHFDKYDQWWLLDEMMEYSRYLSWNTELGVKVDVPGLQKQASILRQRFLDASALFRNILIKDIEKLEAVWLEEQLATYSSGSIGQLARSRYLANTKRHKKFSITSDDQKKQLFYEIMNLPIVKYVKPKKDKKTGRKIYSKNPAVTKEAITLSFLESKRPELVKALDVYLEANHAETLLNNFVLPWIDCVKNGRLHPPFNPCATVSYRIGGKRPYFLNLPFEEEELMHCFRCDEGFGGVHYDLKAGEPTVTCHYSQDPNLLKVFRDGLGDLYLDVGLFAFPHNTELAEGYDSYAPCTSEITDRFKKPRKKAKIAELAMQYGGGEYTIAENLRISLDEAAGIVTKYWELRKHVKNMNNRLKAVHQKRGFLKNVIGRVIRMPTPDHRDTPNRFIQSSCHDFLSLMNLTIVRLCRERGVDLRPVIFDTHDAGTFQCPLEQVPILESIVDEALTIINDKVRMTVPMKIDRKRFTTLAGLKTDDVLSQLDDQEAI